jgi:tripartite-type tricarboxylate transporter receptor subunit TctC
MKKIFLALFMLWSTVALAQFNPAKPIELVVAVSAGGGSDTMARVLASSITTKTINVVNRPGGEMIIGTNYAASSEPNGHTLLLGATSNVIMLPLLQPEGIRYTHNDLVPIASLATMPVVILVRDDFPANNLTEFLQLVKQDPKRYPIGTLNLITKLEADHTYKLINARPEMISYKGDSQLITDIVGGHIPVGLVTIAGAKPFVRDGRAKILGIYDRQRDSEFPNVRTVIEQMPEKTSASKYILSMPAWWGIFAPRGTPKAVLETLNQDINTAIKDPELVKKYKQGSITLAPMTLEQVTEYYNNKQKMLKGAVDQYSRDYPTR